MFLKNGSASKALRFKYVGSSACDSGIMPACLSAYSLNMIMLFTCLCCLCEFVRNYNLV